MKKLSRLSHIIISVCMSLSVQAQIQPITYQITAGKLSPEALDSYPQKLIICENKDSIYRAVVSTFAAYSDSTRREIVLNDLYKTTKTYPADIVKYLDPTALTNYNIFEIKNAADSILNLGDSLTSQVIMNSLKYVSKRITYDNNLAMDLDKGLCTTLSVETILRNGKGTCSEFTNLFLALMRRMGIPCRMAVGYIYMPDNNFEGSHAWAECYINDYGWLAVDPQNAFMWYPPVAIKLFHGRDFIDCKINTLPDMYPVNVKILGNDDLEKILK